MKIRKRLTGILCLGLSILLFGCGSKNTSVDTDNGAADFTAGKGKTVLRILSGSENRELEDIIADCANKENIKIEIDYKGSIDIMRELKDGAPDYDAVWPASSIWISLGDEKHLVKHNASVSLTPVAFGIRKSLAQELGFIGRDVSVQDILAAIREGEMSFCMTSATQSNSGASSYIGFLYALLGKQDGMTLGDLENKDLQIQIQELLSGVERSSGSSDWLKELFLTRDYDAMVNYECLIIDANEQLEKENKEPLYIVYPYDGLSIADSPLGYVDHQDKAKEEAFLAVKQYLLSEKAQSAIEATGRRISINSVSEKNADIFRSDWGVDTKRILSPIQMPEAEVLMKALNIYQTNFKKPSLNIYCLDFSGSMSGDGQVQLKQAMEQILIQENAEKNLLQANEGEVNIVIIFDSEVKDVLYAADSSAEALEELYRQVEKQETGGGTNIYAAVEEALKLASDYELSQYTPAVILMTDGQSRNYMDEFAESYKNYNLDIPVFSITFGDADREQLEEITVLTGARVFDGTENLSEAFRSVKGYN